MIFIDYCNTRPEPYTPRGTFGIYGHPSDNDPEQTYKCNVCPCDHRFYYMYIYEYIGDKGVEIA